MMERKNLGIIVPGNKPAKKELPFKFNNKEILTPSSPTVKKSNLKSVKL